MTDLSPHFQEWILLYGSWGLLTVCFLAGTILPISSEALLLSGIKLGIPVTEALILASAGNCAACLFNYGLGRLVDQNMHTKMARTRAGKLAFEWMGRYGRVSLFASWLPFVGDPITIAAGISRVSVGWFVAIVFPMRILRYAAVIQI